MSNASTWLLKHRMDIYSQTGEDGIIAKILELLPETDKWCVEFGAWDGLFLTNTRYLIESQGYSAVLIEANKKRFNNLQHNYAERSNVITVNEFVGFTERDGLDCILSATQIPINFDLLSIDIDGNDYHVWKAVAKYEPKVVVIEFNPTIPTQLLFVQAADPTINQGASLLALVELGKEKGYELISVLQFNAFFVRKEYFRMFQIENNDPETLRKDLDAITYIFSGFDGQVFLRGGRKLLWHDIPLDEARVQHLPRFLRTFRGNYTLVQKILFAIHRLFVDPRGFANAISTRFRRK